MVRVGFERELTLRILFASIHTLLDTRNGAAHSMRDLLALAARGGARCAGLTGAGFDHPRGENDAVAQVTAAIARLGWPARHTALASPRGVVELVGYCERNVPVHVVALGDPRHPDLGPADAALFGEVYQRVLDRTRPDIVLTYGGGVVGRQIARLTGDRGIPLVFRLSNFSYGHADLFAHASCVLAPSEFTSHYYRAKLGVACTALPSPIDWRRVEAGAQDRRCLTFVGATVAKGAAWAARIFVELARRRPDLPLLVVGGRGELAAFGELGAELAALGSVRVIDSVPDPRVLHAVTRMFLVPSLLESSSRIAQEAIVNGIPVIASTRGGLPETLCDAGTLLDIDDAYTPEARRVPTRAEVEPWIDAILSAWDDPRVYAREVERCAVAKVAFAPDTLVRRYLELFESLRRERSDAVEQPRDALDEALDAVEVIGHDEIPVAPDPSDVLGA